MIEIGTLLQNRYLIEKQIGAGGMGAVYLAVDRRFDNPVAIKETFYKDRKLSEAFEREARLLNNLQHQALPHVSDYFAEADGYFLVMQFIEGEDLSDILKREGAFPVADVLRWTENLLDALDYLHSQEPPIIHRDIKPHNLKLTPRGDVILLDFGLAKLNSEDATGALSVFGYSRTYSPLEQIEGTGTDARSDIFALGATAYHLLTGKPPADALARAASIVNGKSDPLKLASEINDKVPRDFANVLNSALALNPEQRFASAKAMRQALAHAVVSASAANVEGLPEEAVAIAAPAAVPVINSAETKIFPALEAFAAEAANDFAETGGDKKLPVESLIPNAQTSAFAPKVFQDTTAVVDAGTQVSAPRARQSRLRLATIAAVALFCLVSAALYFITKASPAAEPNQTPVVQSTAESETINEAPATISISPTPLLEAARETKAKPPSIEPVVEKRKTDDETVAQTETSDKPKASVPVETTRSAQTKTPPREETRQSVDSRSRVVEQPPVADIESIFTGQSSDNREVDEQQQRKQMNEEKRERIRRERQEKRRERLNRESLPPF